MEEAALALVAEFDPTHGLLGRPLSSHAPPELPWLVGSAAHCSSSRIFSFGLVNFLARAGSAIEQYDEPLYGMHDIVWYAPWSRG